jgi:peptide chain release factor 2
MPEDTKIIDEQIEKLEAGMLAPDFWSDKNKAQGVIKEIAKLKDKKVGLGKYDKGSAILTIISGAGGADAEDFAGILLTMYLKYIAKQRWEVSLLHEHKNDHGGYRNVTIEVSGHPSTSSGRSGPYGSLRNESGVHRLVRISPFNAKKLRHTSFALVEVLPKFSKLEEGDVVLSPDDLKIEFSRSSGPGGQNVNKRDTAVRIVHISTNISAHVSSGRSQEHNRELAMSILRARIFKKAQEDKKSVEESMRAGKNTEIEWGNQIRSYVLHPYKMVKDHRTNTETADVDGVLAGELGVFIEAEKNL